jgi:hypothetical protein
MPRWGLANKQFMRDAYRPREHVQGPVLEMRTEHFYCAVRQFGLNPLSP